MVEVDFNKQRRIKVDLINHNNPGNSPTHEVPKDGAQGGGLISSSRPHIETLQATLTVMRVGRKQVTQSVFRQLEEGSVIDPETGELRGVPWGTVNYFWGNCLENGQPQPLHVVWQLGDELRRCCLEEQWPDRHLANRRLRRCVGRMTPYAEMAVLVEVIAGNIKPVMRDEIKLFGDMRTGT